MVDASGKLTGVGDVGAYGFFYRLGQLRHYAGDYAGAEEAFRRALAIEEKTGGLSQPSSGRTMCWIALQIGYLGRYEEAEQLYVRAEPLMMKSFVASDQPFASPTAGTPSTRAVATVALPYAEKPSGCATSAVAWRIPVWPTPSCPSAGCSSGSNGWTKRSGTCRDRSPSSRSRGRMRSFAHGGSASRTSGWA